MKGTPKNCCGAVSGLGPLGFLWILLLVLFTAVPTALACTIPVFRYALERWPADPYELIVFHTGPLGADQQAVVDWLRKAAPADASGANLRVVTVDLAGKVAPAMQRLWLQQHQEKLPWAVVRHPPSTGIDEPLWAGELNMAAARALIDSPARREIANRILDDESAVWVFLACGDEQKDNAAAKLLGTRLRELQETLKVVVPAEAFAPAAGAGLETSEQLENPLEIDVAFSVVRVSRRDPAERMFVRMLLNSEPDLKTFAQPMAFAVFGRGRLLYALVGKGINKDNIREACEFLVGWCSCQVKAQNPGTDLLMSVDWQAGLKGRLTEDLQPVPLGGSGRLLWAASQDSQPPAEAPSPAISTSSGALVRNVLLAIGGMLAGTIVLLVWVRKRTSRS